MEPRENRAPTCVESHPPHYDESNPTGDETLVIVDICNKEIGLPTQQVHHRDFPETRGEGESLRDCIDQLIFHLVRAREHASETWQRDAIDHAILDVHAFQGSSRA